MGACLPQFRNILLEENVDFVSFCVRQRGEMDFVAVLKRVGSDGQPEVCFSTGYDYVGTLLALEGTLSAGRWREDRPYEENNSK